MSQGQRALQQWVVLKTAGFTEVSTGQGQSNATSAIVKNSFLGTVFWHSGERLPDFGHHSSLKEIVVRQALISDIHGNLEALTAVLAHIQTQNVDRIVCLGDIVGYGPNPCQCLDQVMQKCQLTILGNHDQAALFDPEGFNPVALRAIYWTRDELDRGPGPVTAINRRWDFLSELRKFHAEDDVLYVHGSPRDATNEYVFPESIYDQGRMKILFDKIKRISFQGHTHMPGVFTTDGEFICPEDCDNEFQLGDEKLMINVGSVGQPRDEDPRSCYVVMDSEENSIRFHRVEYDLESTISKIYSITDLDNMLGDRLRGGR